MWCILKRNYWYKGLPGYAAMKRVSKENRMKWPHKALDDPLEEHHGLTVANKNQPDPPHIERLVHHVLTHPSIQLAPHAIGYLYYHSAKHNILDESLWRTLEYQLIKRLSDLNDRMLYGCIYGVIKSNKLRLQTVESIQKEFHIKGLNSLEPYDCFEMIEATSHNQRLDYDAKTYLKNVIIPRMLDMKKHLKFLHIPKYLLELIDNLDRMKYYDYDLWGLVFEMLEKRTFHDVKLWKIFYEKILYLREQGIEKESGYDFSAILERYENQWKNSVDFQYFYNLDEKRNFTVHELIERAKNTPAEMTWEEGEKLIKHTLPEWYFECDRELDEDVADLLDEYKFLKAKAAGIIKEDTASLFNA